VNVRVGVEKKIFWRMGGGESWVRQRWSTASRRLLERREEKVCVLLLVFGRGLVREF
jgi:hypothetical protein